MGQNLNFNARQQKPNGIWIIHAQTDTYKQRIGDDFRCRIFIAANKNKIKLQISEQTNGARKLTEVEWVENRFFKTTECYADNSSELDPWRKN